MDGWMDERHSKEETRRKNTRSKHTNPFCLTAEDQTKREVCLGEA